MSGHWYCSFCNDVVNIRTPAGRWDRRDGEICPVCRNTSAKWVKHDERNVSPETAKLLFAQMRQALT